VSVENLTERGYEPWPEGLVPVSVRARVDGVTHKCALFLLEPCPDYALSYGTREHIQAEDYTPLDKKRSKFTALLPPGSYTAHFFDSDGGHVVSRDFEVPMPAPIVQANHKTFGRFFYRDHGWDRYILIENAYSALQMTEDDVVLDLGAHIGTFTRAASLSGASLTTAYEPERDNFSILTLNCLNDPGVRLRNAVVVPDGTQEHHDRFATLWIDAAVDGDSTRTALHSMYRNRASRVPVRVPAVSLSEALSIQPTVVKIDVEGAELRYDWDVFLDHRQLKSICVEFEKRVGLFENANDHFHSVMKAIGMTCVKRNVGWAVVETWVRL